MMFLAIIVVLIIVVIFFAIFVRNFLSAWESRILKTCDAI